MRLLAIQRKLEQRVTAIMEHQGRHCLTFLASALWVISCLYGTAMRIRRHLYRRGVFQSHRLPCFVISVGNLCIGGTGKTPMTVHLAHLLGEMGFKTAVISRGYKGLCENKGAVVSDGKSILCDALHAGDEPYLMANLLQKVPIVVGKNRVLAGKTGIEQFNPDIILLDDGFQHLRLQRDLNLVLVDAHLPFGNNHVLPRGALRETKAALSDADAVIMTRYDDAALPNQRALTQSLSPRPVFFSSHRAILRGVLPPGHRPVAALLGHANQGRLDQLRGRRLFAFSGLAHNDAFQQTLTHHGGQLVGALGFKDHHPYDIPDANHIIRSAQMAGSDCLVTTDKDYVRLSSKMRFPLELIVMGTTVDFKMDRERWRRFVAKSVGPPAVCSDANSEPVNETGS